MDVVLEFKNPTPSTPQTPLSLSTFDLQIQCEEYWSSNPNEELVELDAVFDLQ